MKYDSGIEDATIVTTHMMLCAKSVGVDSCWVMIGRVVSRINFR
jgi:nitroreductase